MTRIPIILRREFVERVRSRSFILSTILTPVFLSLFTVGPALAGRFRAGGGGVYQISVIDEHSAVGARTVQLINAAPAGDDRLVASEALTGPGTDPAEQLDGMVSEGDVDGYLRFEPGGRVELHHGDELPSWVRARVVAAVSTAVQGERLRQVGVPESELSRLFRPVDVEMIRVSDQPAEERPGEDGFAISLLVGFLLYFLILLYGAQVMHSVQEEKNSRIAEVLVSSVTPLELMLGKVLGVGATALTQVTIWVLFVRLVVGARDSLTGMGIPSMVFDLLTADVPTMVIFSSVGYLVLGFFLYATLFAGVGAAAASTEDAQRFTFPIILPLFVPILLAEVIISAPRGTAATALSWIPLTAPLVMPMRIGAGGVRSWEVWATLAMLALSVVAVSWIAGKIYRVGILSTGTRPSLRELARWVRMA